jgi:hypothetical protein
LESGWASPSHFPLIGINFPVQLDIVGLRPMRITSSSSPESYFGFTY